MKSAPTAGDYVGGDDRPPAGTVGAALLQSRDSCPTSLQVRKCNRTIRYLNSFDTVTTFDTNIMSV